MNARARDNLGKSCAVPRRHSPLARHSKGVEVLCFLVLAVTLFWGVRVHVNGGFARFEFEIWWPKLRDSTVNGFRFFCFFFFALCQMGKIKRTGIIAKRNIALPQALRKNSGRAGLRRVCCRGCVVSRPRPCANGGLRFRRGSGGAGSPENLAFHGVWEHVMPWAFIVCVKTPMRQPRRLPHTRRSAGRRIVAGWGSAGGKGAFVRGSLRAAVGHPSRTDIICLGWRVAVIVAAIRISAEPRCGLFPLVTVVLVRVGFQLPVAVERCVSALSSRA
ncbi:hypothetical protein TcCL_NonESM01797 [Trypanosoma cruzi]|nr:hypothetical protein TcCL_NonESM01797 [Trypanosoma cruzi]